MRLGRGEFHPQCPSWGSPRGSLCAPASGDMGGNCGPAYLPHLPLDSGHCWAHPEPSPGRGPSTTRGFRAGSWVPGEPASGWDSGSPGRWGEGSRGRGGGWGHCGDQITCPGGPGCRDVTCLGGCPLPQAGTLQQAETLEPSLPGRRASLSPLPDHQHLPQESLGGRLPWALPWARPSVTPWPAHTLIHSFCRICLQSTQNVLVGLG